MGVFFSTKHIISDKQVSFEMTTIELYECLKF